MREFSQYNNSSLLIFHQIKYEALVLNIGFLEKSNTHDQNAKNYGNTVEKSSDKRNGVDL